jgi:biotin transport system substrate-specific component
VAILIILSQITIPLGTIAITFSLLAVLIIPAFVDAPFASIACIIYIALGAFGLPVFAGAKGGLSVLLGPTGGYIISYPFMCMCLCHFISIYRTQKKPIFIIIGLILSFIICYTFGAIGLKLYLGCSIAKSLAVGVLPFIIPDTIKAIIAYFIIKRVR